MVEAIVRKDKKSKTETIIRKRILINGKELKMQFTMPIWYRMEEEICCLDDLYTMMHSKERLHEENIPALAALMSGGTFTAREIARDCTPADMRAIIDEISRIVAEAVTMKERKDEDDDVHDEVLEELEKKDSKAD